MYKALPTAYMYSEIFDGPEDDIYKSLQYIDGSIRIKLDQRGLEKEIQLTRSKDPSNTNVSVDITSEAYDQNMEFLREEETTFIDAYTNYRPSSPVIKDSLLIFAFPSLRSIVIILDFILSLFLPLFDNLSFNKFSSRVLVK